MKVYRLLIDISKRQPGGNEYDSEWDISGLSTACDLKEHTWMGAVEWSDPFRYSEVFRTFGKNSAHLSALFLTCRTLSQYNTWESWSGAPSSILCVLPGYVGTGFYGVSADIPYCRKKTMGCLVQGDRLNQAGSLEFRVMRDGDVTDPDVRPCPPVGPAVYGSDFSFSHVFGQVSGLSPEKPLSPTYNFFKVFLRSVDRSIGSTADFIVPVRLSFGGSMMGGSWQVAAEVCCPILHTGIVFTRGLAVVSDTFHDAYSGRSVIAHLGRSFRVDEDNYFGLRLTTKPLARDNIGQPVTRPIDNIDSAHIAVRYAGTLAPLVGTIPDWEIKLYFYRVDKQ
jgi:hypothetical protein